ncbi:MAG: proteasome accessory factor PafA2 family protein [Pirellulales bacterium]
MTLGALAAGDDDWLARRLDPWIKHRLFGAALSERGRGWQDLATNRTLYDELALLNQNYHEFANPRLSFVRLEAAGVIDHRVVERCPIGHEPEPFVPNLGTRAVARAIYLRANSGDETLVMDWDSVRNRQGELQASFADPFAVESE